MMTIKCKYSVTDFIYVDPLDERMRDFRQAIDDGEEIVITTRYGAPDEVRIAYGADGCNAWRVMASGSPLSDYRLSLTATMYVPESDTLDDTVDGIIDAIKEIDGKAMWE